MRKECEDSKMVDILKFTYGAKEAIQYTTDELKECAMLFSSSYGKYRQDSPIRPGENVRMSTDFFEKKYKKENVYIATAREKDKLIGQAVYIRKKYEDVGTMTWIMQLVVDKDYREHGIGSTLLRSIWGFSNDFAWGLATANPCTVKALESATFRKCSPSVISSNLKYIKRLSDEISFVKDDGFCVNDNHSIANTNFFIDNSEFIEAKKEMSNWQLGELKPGYEWLAFTFKSQEIDHEKYVKHFENMLEFSESKLQEAYSRMQMSRHSWTKGTENEINTILSKLPQKEIHKVLDLGCGVGRHSIELAKKGFEVVGVDYSRKHTATARKSSQNLNVQFRTCDIRKYRDEQDYDLVLCLFDVVGSYPDDKNNLKILETVSQKLRKDGYCAISVMNMELTNHIVPDTQKGDVLENPELLYRLHPSNIMQQTGNIFDPQYIVIDQKESLVYRKEQFMEDEELPAEYVIRDKRYYRDEIVHHLENMGLKVLEASYVQAGKFDVSLESIDSKAKEILIIAQKK